MGQVEEALCQVRPFFLTGEISRLNHLQGRALERIDTDGGGSFRSPDGSFADPEYTVPDVEDEGEEVEVV